MNFVILFPAYVCGMRQGVTLACCTLAACDHQLAHSLVGQPPGSN